MQPFDKSKKIEVSSEITEIIKNTLASSEGVDFAQSIEKIKILKEPHFLSDQDGLRSKPTLDELKFDNTASGLSEGLDFSKAVEIINLQKDLL